MAITYTIYGACDLHDKIYEYNSRNLTYKTCDVLYDRFCGSEEDISLEEVANLQVTSFSDFLDDYDIGCELVEKFRNDHQWDFEGLTEFMNERTLFIYDYEQDVVIYKEF